ncbi:hypothetical protein [Desulfosarcina sp.]|uniref:hypothetical protein n=1 Tax=Desulfosarcina sp. TaxID=2027861 RepID=UPI003970AF91
MVRKDEISSTEKLLDLIRDNTSPPASADPAQPAPVSLKTGLFKALPFQKAIGIGVEIGAHDIRIARVNRISEKSFELIDYASVAVEPGDKYHAPQLAKHLAALLSRFCAGLKRYEIWCCVASAKVETRCIRIPKLPKKQIPNAVYWTFSKEVPFNDKEVLLDFRILGDVNENGMTKTRVMTFTIPIAETEALKRLFVRTGYPLAGISIVPFAIQNLLKTDIVTPKGHDVCCLFVGEDWSRITIYANANLVLSRGIKAGLHSMIDAIAEQHRHCSPTAHSPMRVMEGRDGDHPTEKDAHYAAAQEDLHRFLLDENTTDTGTRPQGQCRIDCFQAILPAVERLVKQVERTIAHYCIHFQRSGVSEILLSGKVAGSSAIIAHIGSQLGIPVNSLNPFPQPHPFTSKVKIPDLPAVKESFVPSIGIGLSSNDLTPNFLFTHRHRERRDRARKVRIGISAACVGFLVMLLCGYIWQENRMAAKAAELARLTRQRDAFNVPLTQELVMALYAKVNEKRSRITTLSERYYCSAVIAEVSQLTAANIQLITLRADMNAPAEAKKIRLGSTLTLDGIITGETIRFETDLASYMLAMEASLLFKKPVLKNKRLQFLGEQQVLRFSIQLELV